jgi:hypothetical protein
VPPSYNIKWNDFWRKNHAKKDAGFIWALYHKVIDVNAWKVQMWKDIDVSCPMWDLEIPETLIHKFYDCPRAKMAWTWAATIIYRLKHPPHMDGNMKKLGVRQCLFNKKHLLQA